MPKLTKYPPTAFAKIAKRMSANERANGLVLNADAFDVMRREVQQLATRVQPQRNQQRHDVRRSGGHQRRGGGNSRRRRGQRGDDSGRRNDSGRRDDGWRRGEGTDARDNNGGGFRRATLGTQDEDLKAFQSGLNKVNDDNIKDVLKRLVAMAPNEAFVGMLVESATQQAQYTPLYVRIFNALVGTWKDTSPELVAKGNAHVVDSVINVPTERVTKLNAKGYGRFAVHLCLTGVITRDTLETYVQRWADALTANENAFNVCELLVFLCQELATHDKLTWSPIIGQRVAPLWDDTNTLRQRYKIRLLDVKDAFA